MHICHYLAPLVQQRPKGVSVEWEGRRKAGGKYMVQMFKAWRYQRYGGYCGREMQL